MNNSKHEAIAIIGIGCRFPGGVHDLESFWQLLRDGVDAIQETPASRFDLDAFYSPNPATPGKVMTRFGGYLDQIDAMDASFFNISPREAERMDPQQRILLEVAWEALENAGQPLELLRDSQTGVFVGQWLSDFEARLFSDPRRVDFYMTTGSGRYSASGRLSYIFGLQGSSLTLDTACSSSLAAVHLACQSLHSGESDMALVGAANVILQPHITIAYSQSRMMAPDGHCKFGDASGDGYVRSEGAAALVLKRLSNAIEAGDPIQAVILGSALNNDGQSSGFLTTPGGAGQEDLLRKAYRAAGITPGIVQYVEAHGTGTSAGDPVEITALGNVLRDGRQADQICYIGSVKTNFGHTEGAAGLAGLIKVVLALKHKMIPPSLHFHNPSPKILWEELPLRVQNELAPWPEREGPAIAGVSAFGIAGTNGHVVLQEAPSQPGLVPPGPHSSTATPFLPISARTPEALVELAQRYHNLFNQAAIDPGDLIYTAGARRTHHDIRLAVLGLDQAQIMQGLSAYLNGETSPQILSGQKDREHKIVFVFPGQGSQWLGMGRQLMQEQTVFRQAIERCQQAFTPYVDWSLADQIQADGQHSRYEEINVIQPVLFAIEVALAELWRSWGIEPDAVIGHSMGEAAAAYIAGALSLEDAACVICTRSRLMKRVSGKGAMSVVELSFSETQTALRGYETKLSIAVSNGPRSTVIAGDPAALETLTTTLQENGVFCRAVNVDVAAHSPHMDALRPELEEALTGLQPQPASIPIYSTVTSELVDFLMDAEYWGRNLRQPVLFSTATQRLQENGINTFIECSPHPILLPAIGQIQSTGSERLSILTIPSSRRGENESTNMFTGLAKLYTSGYALDWARLTPVGRCLTLPTYPWQRERFWAKEAETGTHVERPSRRLLDMHLEVSRPTSAHIWQSTLSLDTFPYLSDHRVGDLVLLPAAAFAEMVFEAASDLFGKTGCQLEQLQIAEALNLLPDKPRILQLTYSKDDEKFSILSRMDELDWTLHAQGILRPLNNKKTPDIETSGTDALPADKKYSGSEHVSAMHARGLHYGPAFQAVKTYSFVRDKLLGELYLPSTVEAGDYVLHPCLLDAAFQLLIAALPDGTAPGDAYLPVQINDLQVFATPVPGTPIKVLLAQHAESNAEKISGDLILTSESGQMLLRLQGLEMQRYSQKRTLDSWLYRLTWQPANKITATSGIQAATGRWLIYSDQELGQSLAAQLAEKGSDYILVHEGEDYRPYFNKPYRTVVFARTDLSPEPASAERHTVAFLEFVQSLSAANWPQPPHLWLITQGAQAVTPGESASPALSALWGLAASLAHEMPELNCTRLDLDAHTNPELLLTELLSGAEDLIALRGENRFIAQLNHLQVSADTHEQYPSPAAQRSFRAETLRPGVLDGLALRAVEREQPGPGKVEIEVHATGLNFMNVLAALGVLPGYPDGVGPLGIECSGVISALGEGVSNFKIGDDVLAVALHSLGSHVITAAELVQPMPASLSFEEASTLPITFLTAYYALNYLGRMRRGERVLVHAATGGVGLAAIQLAQHAGAEVFATAGSKEKRQYLRSLGIRYVMDSRSLDFADKIMELTNGQGVDLVLNSLAGEAIPKGLAALAPYGRFLEIGKRDIYQKTHLGLSPFQKNLSYYAIDLDRMTRERPQLLGQLFGEILALFETGAIRPLPVTRFPIAQFEAAFRYMAQAKHIGKVVIDLSDQDVQLLPSFAETALVKPTASYLITGGLGALGLSMAAWLAEQGARHLILTGRSGSANLSKENEKYLADLEVAGVKLLIAQTDVANDAQVAGLLEQIKTQFPPLKGIIHAAGVLEDGIIMQQTPARLHKVLAPKANGAWNLHQMTLDLRLDFFVLFSSISAPLGSPGQSNYAAANAYLDGLAHLRHTQGLPALSVNWGPWSKIGLAAQRELGGLQGLQGITAIEPLTGVEIFDQLLHGNFTQVLATGMDPVAWCQSHPSAQRSTLFTSLLSETEASGAMISHADTSDDIRTALLTARTGHDRRAILEAYIQEQAADVLGLPPARVDRNKPLRTLGMDSLMTIEFRNFLELGLGLTLSATLVFNYPTVADLTTFLAEKMDISLTTKLLTPSKVDSPPSKEIPELDDLSSAEVEALLADELDAIDDLLRGLA